MKFSIKTLILALFTMSICYSQSDSEQDIQVTIKNLNSNDGKVFISLYKNEDNFLETGFKGDVVQINNKSCEYIFENIQPGTYAISFFHDENDNGKMDTNVIGIPKEDYGCSNNARGTLGPPKWEDAKFEVKSETVNQIITL